ncbi:siderophore-interacting protein [Pseudonocardia sp. MH-G8]|uniref:siderophore-interacting protein n=1 Tax=Pseudonocardia sp. MH-G8 TaxID=1854588 RepID=UPI000BA13BE3|nr:siderophore-interacting protein [Pseudonocardia sp. MH-G8]OZM77518.1 NADPH-dependent ferric siderophore reductase [Pseudonocardia sp. MH-G8]
MAGGLGRWLLEVRRTERVTPQMARVTLHGDLSGYTPLAPDQQVKLFFPRPGHDVTEVPAPPAGGDGMAVRMSWYQAYLAVPEERRPWMRTYSVRRHRPERNEIDVDFVLHDHGDTTGPASRWAAQAGEGDVIALVGPAASHFRTPGPHDWTLLAGDETALPAIGALLEAMPAGQRAEVFVEVADAGEEQPLPTAAQARVRWLHRGDVPAGRSDALVEAVRAADLPAGAVYAWLAGEASAVRALRRHLVGERGVDKRQIAFAGYWRLHMTQDAGPTPEEESEAAEVMAELTEQP